MGVIHLLVAMLSAAVWGTPYVAVAQLPSASTTELSIIAAAVDSLYMRDGVGRVVVSATAAGSNGGSVDIHGIANLVSSRTPLSFLERDSLNKTPLHSPDAYWKSFFAAYPGAKGLVTVSRPEISDDGQTAVLYIGMGCGGRCGAWGVAHLRRVGDRWHATRFVVDRVS
jgi:hypothetical protein